MREKKDIYDLSIEDLVELAKNPQPSEKTTSDQVNQFILELNIRHGSTKVHNSIIYYEYKKWITYGRQTREEFFKYFSKRFASVRQKDGVYYLLDPNCFDTSRESYLKARRDFRNERRRKEKQKTQKT